MADKTRAAKKPVGKKAARAETGITYTVTPDQDSGQYPRMLISINSQAGNGITRVETAFISPSGSIGVLKARKINPLAYETVLRSSEAGEFKVSIAAYGHGEIMGLLTSKFTIAAPNGHSTESPSVSSVVNIPAPPSEIRKRSIKTWPISSAYSKALQNLNFSVSSGYQDLRSGKLIANPNVKFTSYIFGSGNFGVVFKMDTAGSYHALKCFTRAAPDIAERYYYLSSYLSRVSLPFLVNFKYLSKAVRVLSNPKDFYPALMMDWVEGQNVNEFIEKHIGDPNAILAFGENFISTVSRMQSAGIAHGDLSGDNILVTDSGSVTYIDYDGMFIPNLSGKNAPEKGHENFQHPARNTEYAANLDNFSALVIYLTAVSVAEDREIWKYNNGDRDRLIFRSEDFKKPAASELFGKLKNMSRRVKKLTALLEDYLTKDPLWEGASPSVVMNL